METRTVSNETMELLTGKVYNILGIAGVDNGTVEVKGDSMVVRIPWSSEEVHTACCKFIEHSIIDLGYNYDLKGQISDQSWDTDDYSAYYIFCIL